jgi:hypothetical protein
MKELIYEVSGVVEAPPEAVATAVLDRVGQAAAGYVPVVEASNGNWTAAVQGGWWYRGEYTVEPAPSGSRFTHRVYNVATWMRWGVPLANRFFVGYRPTVREGIDKLVRDIGDELGCAAHLDS